jgi:K+-transporting ATPase ATPase B chain
VALARRKYNVAELVSAPEGSEFIEFSAETRVSGIKIGERSVLKGAGDSIEKQLKVHDKTIPDDTRRKIEEIARLGGTPLVVVDGGRTMGVVYLKDIVKAGIKERLADLRKMGIKSIMITGDNPLTAAAIAAEAGVDDYLAQATPEQKLKLIRKMQTGGELVAMVGDGTNDAPALAQSDVAVVMNSGTQAAKEAGNMIDLDSDPTKLIEIVEIGKQLLMTRGSLTTFSIANDLAKYFAIIPAAFASTYPELGALNIMHLTSPVSAMLSAVIFNALIIIGLIPLALRGVAYRPVGAAALLRHNLLVYGLGGVVVPFVGIKVIDVLLTMIGAV